MVSAYAAYAFIRYTLMPSSWRPTSVERPRNARFGDAFLLGTDWYCARCDSENEGCFALESDRTDCRDGSPLCGRPHGVRLGVTLLVQDPP